MKPSSYSNIRISQGRGGKIQNEQPTKRKVDTKEELISTGRPADEQLREVLMQGGAEQYGKGILTISRGWDWRESKDNLLAKIWRLKELGKESVENIALKKTWMSKIKEFDKLSATTATPTATPDSSDDEYVEEKLYSKNESANCTNKKQTKIIKVTDINHVLNTMVDTTTNKPVKIKKAEQVTLVEDKALKPQLKKVTKADNVTFKNDKARKKIKKNIGAMPVKRDLTNECLSRSDPHGKDRWGNPDP